MANRLFSPSQQFADATGLPYAGGTLSFYATGTSTPLNTYSDSALTIANTNPVVLDSAGRAGAVFLQNLPYKVVLADVNAVQVWTQDPVWSSDYSTLAQVQPYAGNPNGVLAGTAGTQGALPGSSIVWDYTNNILYVCTTTGTASTAVWTAVNTPTTSSNIPPPAGYLTLNNDPSNPILTADSIGSTAVYYTPYVGNIVPIYNGTSFALQSFTQLTLTLSASQAADTIYDVFVFNNAGVPTLVTGPAWNSSTAGSSLRGTGAGTTQLQRLNGIWVNAVQISGKNGSTTYTIGANLATYLGTIYIDHTAGQVTCHRAYGQNRKWGAWNAYNRTPTILRVGDATANWTNGSATIKASNNVPATYTSIVTNVGSGTASNGAGVLCGLPEEELYVTFNQAVNSTANTNVSFMNNGVGINSITAITGVKGQFQNQSNAGSNSLQANIVAQCFQVPFTGLINVQCCEAVPTNGTQNQYLGSETNMEMSIWYLA